MERNLHPEQAAARAADPKQVAMERTIRTSFSVAIVHGMIFALCSLIAGFILMLFIPVATLRERPMAAAKAAEPGGDVAAEAGEV
ncbi:MAG: hypothetical protein Q7U11_22405, partial [Phenylobacterium sp.]|nr:hypothetical protein [Phenylobacterium sp.]